MPRYAAETVTLLSNAGATGGGKSFAGGSAVFVMLPGTGGATTALQVLGPDGTTWVGITNASGTTALALPLELAPGTYRAEVVSGLATPVNAAFTTATTGGTLAAGTYSYRVAAKNAIGRTLASAATTIATTGATSTVTVNWGAVSGATGYDVFGRIGGSEQLIASVGATTTYTDTGSITPSGALPTSNSAQSTIYAEIRGVL